MYMDVYIYICDVCIVTKDHTYRPSSDIYSRYFQTLQGCEDDLPSLIARCQPRSQVQLGTSPSKPHFVPPACTLPCALSQFPTRGLAKTFKDNLIITTPLPDYHQREAIR